MMDAAGPSASGSACRPWCSPCRTRCTPRHGGRDLVDDVLPPDGRHAGYRDLPVHRVEGNWVVPYMADTFPTVKFTNSKMVRGKQRREPRDSRSVLDGPRDSKNKPAAWQLITLPRRAARVKAWTSKGLAPAVAERRQAGCRPRRRSSPRLRTAPSVAVRTGLHEGDRRGERRALGGAGREADRRRHAAEDQSRRRTTPFRPFSFRPPSPAR